MSRTRTFKICHNDKQLAIISVSGDYANVFVKVENPKIRIKLFDDWATEEQVITDFYED
jgi:hypothetical protein